MNVTPGWFAEYPMYHPVAFSFLSYFIIKEKIILFVFKLYHALISFKIII